MKGKSFSKSTWATAKQMYDIGRPTEIIADRTGIARTTITARAQKEGWKKPNRMKYNVSTAIQDLDYCVGKWAHLLTFLGSLGVGESDELIALLKHVDDIHKLTVAIKNATASRKELLDQEHALPHIALVEWSGLLKIELQKRITEDDYGKVLPIIDALQFENREAVEKIK